MLKTELKTQVCRNTNFEVSQSACKLTQNVNITSVNSTVKILAHKTL